MDIILFMATQYLKVVDEIYDWDAISLVKVDIISVAVEIIRFHILVLLFYKMSSLNY